MVEGQIIDTLTPKHRGARADNDTQQRAEPVWSAQGTPASWRAVWAYSTKRFVRDNKTLTLQENRARAVIEGDKAARATRFVKTSGSARSLDEAALARARMVAGLKGYVTNIPAAIMPAGEVISSYHDLWHVEASFCDVQDGPSSPSVLRTHPRSHRGSPHHRVHRAGGLPHDPGPHGPLDPQGSARSTAIALSNHRSWGVVTDVAPPIPAD